MINPTPTLTDDDAADAAAFGARVKHLAACFAATLVDSEDSGELLTESAAQLHAAMLHVELMRGWFRRNGADEKMLAKITDMAASHAREQIASVMPKAEKLYAEREAAKAAPLPPGIDGESAVERARREKLEHQTATLARHLKRQVPPGTGFILFCADFGERGATAYAASVERESAIKLVREWLGRMQ